MMKEQRIFPSAFRRMIVIASILSVSILAQARPIIRPQPMPLDQHLPIKIAPSGVVLGFDASDTARNGEGFGLIGVIVTSAIDSQQNQRGEIEFASFRDKIAGYPFKDRVDAALRAKAASPGLSPAPLFGKEAAEDRVATRVLHILPSYTIDHDFERIRVRLDISVTERRKGSSREVLSRYYVFDSIIDSGDFAQRAAAWHALDRAALEAILDQGVVQVVDMLVHDFSPEGRAEWNRSTLHKNALIKGRRIRGLAVRQGEDWVWMRGAVRGGTHPEDSGYGIHGYRIMMSDPLNDSANARVSDKMPGTSIPTP